MLFILFDLIRKPTRVPILIYYAGISISLFSERQLCMCLNKNDQFKYALWNVFKHLRFDIHADAHVCSYCQWICHRTLYALLPHYIYVIYIILFDLPELKIDQLMETLTP